MAYLIGIDEAGYGPNLGPLVISVATWQVSAEPWDLDLYNLLAGVVCARSDGQRWAIADSKQLYQPGRGLGLLECGVHTALRLAGRPAADWRGIWDVLRADPAGHRQRTPWYAEYNAPLPAAAKLADVVSLADRVDRHCEAAGARLVDVRSRAVFPQEFNELVHELDGKGAALSSVTLDLLASVLAQLPPEPTLVTCDKHGGRNRYGPILQRHFPDCLVEVRRESRGESVYCWGPAQRRTEVRFRAGGEAFLPTALASMTAKYLRELAMEAFNDFWRGHLPELRRTAGYPLDARRFRQEIAACQARLKIDDAAIWRVR